MTQDWKILVRKIAKGDAWLESMPKTCSRVWEECSRAIAAKITNFFKRVDEPLPIRWTPSAEPPRKSKCGSGRPRKVQPPHRSHSFRISTASHLHLSACASLWLRPVRAIFYTWLTSLRGTDDLYDATLECARGNFFPVWREIRNYCFGIFNFDAE